MKIVIFSDNFYPELSGISDSIVTTAKGLAKLGHKICFFVPNYSEKNFKTANIESKKEIDLGDRISVKRFFSFFYPGPTKQSRMVIPTGFRTFTIKKFKPDIIHTQLFFGVGLEALIAAKILKVPFIGTNHTAISEFIRHAPIKGKWLEKAGLKYVNWYYGKCNFVSAPSQSVFEEMEKFGFKTRHEVISNPVNTGIFSAFTEYNKSFLKNKFGINDKTLVYAGRFAPEKNIDIIIKAIALVKKKIPDIMLAMAGGGSSLETIKNLTKELGVQENVKFLGILSQFDLANLYRVSEIFTITSTSETQSMTLIQAMACGLPVIGVRARALPEYIENNGILIEPGDFKGLSEKIVELLENQSLRTELGGRGLKFVQKFSDKNIALKWEEIYKREIANYGNSL